MERGGYVLWDSPAAKSNGVELVVMGTGSEVEIALKGAKQLAEAGVGVRVVSLPCWELFSAQDEAYRNEVIPPAAKKVSIEAATTFGWERWVGNDPKQGASIGINHFGASAPFERIYKEYGLTAEAVVAKANELLGK